MKQEEIRTVVVPQEPDKKPHVRVIRNALWDFQQEVGGRIETFPFGGYLGICNDEGKFNGMKLNRRVHVKNDQLFGPVVITKADGEEFVSLSGDEVEEVMSRLEELPL